METLLKTPVSEIVLSNFRAAEVFHRYHIDFCCNGNKTLEEACLQKQLATTQLLNELREVMTYNDNFTTQVNQMTLSQLVDYIIERHHSYLRTNIPILQEFLTKISRVHADNHPELIEVKSLFDEAAGNLVMHMQKEEIILFPYIKKLDEAYRNHSHKPRNPFGRVNNPIQMMILEHQAEGDRFERMANLTQNYQIPSDACNTYRVSMQKLEEFEKDLHTHIHLENNILFPQTIELENKF